VPSRAIGATASASRSDRFGQLVDVEQLRADMGVHTLHVQFPAAFDAGDGRPRVVGQQAELRARVTSRLGLVRGSLNAGNDPDQTGLPSAGGHDAFQPVDVVEVVDHEQPDTVVADLRGHRDFFVGLRVAVQHQPRGVGTRLQRRQDLPAACHIEVQAFGHHHALNSRAREGLRRERHIAAGPPAAEGGQVVAGPAAQCGFVDDDDRGAELRRHLVEAATADDDGAVAVETATRREQLEQLVGGRGGRRTHRPSVPSPAAQQLAIAVR